MEEDSDNNNSTSVSNKDTEFEPRGGIPNDYPPTRRVLKFPPEVHCGCIFLGTYTALLDTCNDDILDGVWPGSHDIQLLTCFVMTHCSGDWTSYLHFAKWADSRLLTAPGSPILLEIWLQSKCGGGDGLRDGAASETWYCLRSLGGIVTDNMCDKTCDQPLLIVGEIIMIAGHRDALGQDSQGGKRPSAYPGEEASEEERMRMTDYPISTEGVIVR
jgi:hypothetical protein